MWCFSLTVAICCFFSSSFIYTTISSFLSLFLSLSLRLSPCFIIPALFSLSLSSAYRVLTCHFPTQQFEFELKIHFEMSSNPINPSLNPFGRFSNATVARWRRWRQCTPVDPFPSWPPPPAPTPPLAPCCLFQGCWHWIDLATMGQGRQSHQSNMAPVLSFSLACKYATAHWNSA